MQLITMSAILLVLPFSVNAQPGWKDCATEPHYRMLQDGEWKERKDGIELCYDTHAFRLTAPQYNIYTGITRYTQHLENGYLVEEFFSEENKKSGESELRFHIVRSMPAIVTIVHLPDGETWQIQSTTLKEVKLEAKTQ